MMAITFSTWLTISRIALSPCVMLAIYFQAWFVALIIFMIAASTDFFDGYYARLYHQETRLGQILDPVADKILLFSTLISLCMFVQSSLIPSWFVILFFAKDCLLVIGAYFLLQYKQSMIFAPSWFSKVSTALCMFFLIYCIVLQTGYCIHNLTDQLIWFFACSAMIILIDYSYKFYRLLSV